MRRVLSRMGFEMQAVGQLTEPPEFAGFRPMQEAKAQPARQEFRASRAGITHSPCADVHFMRPDSWWPRRCSDGLRLKWTSQAMSRIFNTVVGSDGFDPFHAPASMTARAGPSQAHGSNRRNLGDVASDNPLKSWRLGNLPA